MRTDLSRPENRPWISRRWQGRILQTSSDIGKGNRGFSKETDDSSRAQDAHFDEKNEDAAKRGINALLTTGRQENCPRLRSRKFCPVWAQDRTRCDES